MRKVSTLLFLDEVDIVEAVDGSLDVVSPAGGPTTVRAAVLAYVQA